MQPDEVIEVFKKTGALLQGHFLYASGRHGRQFLQASRVLQYPDYTEKLCKCMARLYENVGVELVIGPATGGILLAHETARHLHCRAAFTEKDDEGGFSLKRGFALKPGTRVMVVEDIITTGSSVEKTIRHLRGRGAEIMGVTVLIDRSGGEVKLDCRFDALAQLTLDSWEAIGCDLCAKAEPLLDPDDLVV